MGVAQVPYEGYPTIAPQFEPTPEIHVDTPPAAFGVNVGQSVEHLGQVQEAAGEELFNRAASSDASRSARRLYVKVCMAKNGYALTQTRWCQNPHDEVTEDCVIPTITR